MDKFAHQKRASVLKPLAKLFVTALLMLSIPSHPIFANSFDIENPDFFIWDNTYGVNFAQHCQVIEGDAQFFQASIVKGYGDHILKRGEGNSNYTLNQGSLLKMLSEPLNSMLNAAKRDLKVEVIGVNQNRWTVSPINGAKTFHTSETGAKRFDQGLLSRSLIRPLNGASAVEIIELSSAATFVTPETFKRAQELNKRVRGKLLKPLALPNGKTLSLQCPQFRAGETLNLFAIFNSYVTMYPSAYIGISQQETAIFKSITIHENMFPDFTISQNELSIQFEQHNREQNKKYLFSSIAQDIEDILDHNFQATRASSQVAEGPMQTVICSQSPVNVRSDDFKKILFTTTLGEKVKVFQNLDGSQKFMKRNKISYEMLKVEFPDQESKSKKLGFVAKNFVSLEGDCEFIKKLPEPTQNQRENSSQSAAPITGVNDEKCCNFPTAIRPTQSYRSGIRAFGAGRDNGRSHAANDLYRTKDESVYAVAGGKIDVGLYYFYLGTYAIEVKHEGGFVVRYGEVTGKKIPGLKVGSKVKTGDRLGYIAKINLKKCCEPMLHFELYSGAKKGTLSGGGKYQRRSDLLNPTSYLQKWENLKFGTSY